MDPERRSNIYKRLLEMKLNIEFQNIPDPQYINNKIAECHIFREEIEHYTIETLQEISIIQQALNNAKADFEAKKDNLLSQNQEIRSLPNIKDREARVNAYFKKEQETLKDFDNELLALNHLLKALNLKARNLNSANSDLKAHIKIMDNQIKLNTPDYKDPTVKSLMDELKKSKIDNFEEAAAKIIENETVDPSEPLNVDNLLSQGKGEGLADLPSQPIPDTLIDPSPDLDIDEMSLIEDDEEPLAGIEVKITEEKLKEPNNIDTNLDKIINLKPEEGGVPAQKQKSEMSETEKKAVTSESEPNPVIQQRTTKSLGIDLDALLEDLQF